MQRFGSLPFDAQHLDLSHMRSEYSAWLDSTASDDAVIEFYVAKVGELLLNPSQRFDEHFYLTTYQDVENAVRDGSFLCGFHHWLIRGQDEGRLTAPQATDAGLADLRSNLDVQLIVGNSAAALNEGSSLEDVFQYYLANAAVLKLKPSPEFDEAAYQEKYPDVVEAISKGAFVSGFHHWVVAGRKEGRNCLPAEVEKYGRILWDELDLDYVRANYTERLPPNACPEAVFEFYVRNAAAEKIHPSPFFDEVDYCERYRDVGQSVEDGFYVSGFHHWILTGRDEGRASKLPRSASLSNIEEQRFIISSVDQSAWLAHFEADYYSRYLFEKFGRTVAPERALEVFLSEGVFRRDVPTSKFDEDFYISYYEDIAQAQAAGTIPSGYVHFVVAGEREGRLPTHDLARCLVKKLGSLTEPVFLGEVDSLEAKLALPSVEIVEEVAHLNVFVSSLDPDIMFGGYISLLNFVSRVVENGTPVRLFVCEDGQSNRTWFLRGISKNQRWFNAFEKCEFVNLHPGIESVTVGPDDICLAYSVWTAYKAAGVARKLKHKRFIMFAQEYEPIFYDNGSVQFLAEASYNLDHVALFNTSILSKFFSDKHIGVFSRNGSGKFLTYEHALAGNKPDAAYLRSKTGKTLLFYARPEKHAGRNLFEIGVIALREAVRRGVITEDWRLVGLGGLGPETDLELGSGCRLVLRPRIPHDEYKELLRGVDVGLSLMWAPHPSILPFELAKAGAVCVTNVYENRPAELLEGFGYNIVPAEPSIEGIADAIAVAVDRVADVNSRIEGSRFEWPVDWDEVFTPAFVDAALGLPRS